MQSHLITSNIILYCKEWEKTVHFYKDALQLPITFSTDWFVEFQLTQNSTLSIADERRSSRKSIRGKGITIALEVDDIDDVWKYMDINGLKPTKIKEHPWNARVFYIFDPEKHQIEIWQSLIKEDPT